MTTQPKAQYRKDYQPPAFEIESTDLVFHLDNHKTRVQSTLAMRRTTSGSESLELDGDALLLKSVALDGRILGEEEYQLESGKLTITKVPQQFVLAIETEIDPAGNKALEGLYKSGGAFCTQCEAEGFRRITYFLDRPDILSLYTTTIIADPKKYPHALANGNLISEKDLANGLRQSVWQDPFKKPSYLFALVAGDFDCLADTYVTTSGREVALKFYVDKGNMQRAHFAMASLKNAMKWDEDVFGLEYDLDIYMVVAVDFFNMGAMENKGLNVFNSRFVLADADSATDLDYHNIESIIGHEYFHNWTGNRVTCRDWFQLSLKEGLTVFRDQQFSADMGSEVVNRISAVRVMRGHQFAEDAGPMAHPIRPEKVIEMNNFYTVTVYDKGAEVIRMMHTLLGQQGFRAGMDLYFERHDGQAVTCDDFVQAMADANHFDMSQFKRWYGQSGTPDVHADYEWNPQQQRLTLTLSQSHAATADQADKQDLLIPVKMELISQNGPITDSTLDGQPFSGMVLLTQRQQSFVFDNVTQEPCVSLMQDFSAPVRVNIARSIETAWVLAHASDNFARWDVLQSLYKDLIIKAYEDDTALPSVPEDVAEALRHILRHLPKDLAFVAELLQLPSAAEVMEEMHKPDPVRLSDCRSLVEKHLAQVLKTECHSVYAQFIDAPESLDGNAAGGRALKNACLRLLSKCEETLSEVLLHQYHSRSNMTDKLAVLDIAARSQSEVFDQLMQAFFEQTRDDSLTADKYLALVASWSGDDVYERIEAARQHPQYDDGNPNKVRSLDGTLFMANHKQFYRQDGTGFALFAERLALVDQTNPQLASRLITPALGWKRVDDNTGAALKNVLETLRSKADLSRDLFEKIEKALS